MVLSVLFCIKVEKNKGLYNKNLGYLNQNYIYLQIYGFLYMWNCLKNEKIIYEIGEE